MISDQRAQVGLRLLKHILQFQHRENFLIPLSGLVCINPLNVQVLKSLTGLPKTALWLDIILTNDLLFINGIFEKFKACTQIRKDISDES